MTADQTRAYSVNARSTDIFGRVLCQARHHHFVVDGPVQNGCPGEAITPPEAFLAAIAACGVELVEVIAREQGAGPVRVQAAVEGRLDRSRPVRTDVTVFNEIRLDFELTGVSAEEGAALVEAFRRR